MLHPSLRYLPIHTISLCIKSGAILRAKKEKGAKTWPILGGDGKGRQGHRLRRERKLSTSGPHPLQVSKEVEAAKGDNYR